MICLSKLFKLSKLSQLSQLLPLFFFSFAISIGFISAQANETNNLVKTETETESQKKSASLSEVPDNFWLSYDVKILQGEELEKYYQIINNLRCPVCQGQSIAESDTSIALDLKAMVYQKISEGFSEKEIQKILAQRYGSYINFNPPVNEATLPLWFLPFLIAIFGVLFVYYRSRTRRAFEKWK